ncbi:transglycosylase domain-containing protein [Lachnospiraceae bacterium OttesenSCG-928-D06]|nr:transglycosylase domain-containing protein [Lachnospiraceae bacterium OttesenSCG-928-D06]
MNYGKNGVRTKQKTLNSKSPKWIRKLVLTGVRVFLIAVIGIGVCGAAAGIGMFKGIIASTPTINISDIAPSGQSTLIYDREGNEIDKYVSSNSNRIIVTMDKVPANLSNAFVAIEDERFYEHNGIDIRGLFRAAYQFLKTGGDETQGASTITQQLLKNVVFTDWTSEGDNMVKKVKRKLQEQYLALEVSKVTQKDEVLLQYMNAINLGQNTLGIEAASQRYFGKSCSELTLSECAVIASITQNPSRYNPLKYPDKNATRRKACLNKMLELGNITQEEYDIAMADSQAVYERIAANDNSLTESNSEAGSYFSDALQKQVLADMIAAGYSETTAYSLLLSGGLRIHSTLDPKIQAIFDEEAANPDNYPNATNWLLDYALTLYAPDGSSINYSKENMQTYFKQNVDKNFNLIFSSYDSAYEAIAIYRQVVMDENNIANVEENYLESINLTAQPQISLTLIDQETGYVLALVGGRGTKEGRLTLNRATDTVRSPGSTFKVLASFAPALDSENLNLSTVYEDAPFAYDDGRPVKNWYTTGYRGICTIRYAIEQSLNVIAVKNLTVITPQLGYDYLMNFGFTTITSGTTINNEIFTDVRQPLALGGLTRGVKNVELCAAYATIANGGVYVTPKLYTKVVDSDGNVILDNTTPETRQVLKATTAYLLTDAMVDVVTKGTGTGARFPDMAIAGKTGTTSDNWDVWFAGYTPYYTCVSWAGYDNNVSLSSSNANKETNIAKVLWKAVMSRIHTDLPNQSFARPTGIVTCAVCSKSGKLPIDGLCNSAGTVTTEYFADGTQPTESCDVHYAGPICAYDHLPASELCEFVYHGVATLPLIEDVSLLSGSMNNTNPDGTTGNSAPLSNRCQHDESFYANPDYEAILNGQRFEMEQRGDEAWQAYLSQQQPPDTEHVDPNTPPPEGGQP